MIDCHCHLSDRDFDSDLDDVVSRARAAGVIACIVVPENINDFPRVLDICQKHEGFLFPCLGVHPAQNFRDEKDDQIIGTRSVDAGKDRVEEILSLIEKHRETIVGIGEVGLDYVPRNCPNGEADKQSQRDVLSRQAEIAHRLDLPLNVHSRSAGKPTIAFLKELGVKNAMMHAFDGNAKAAKLGCDQDYYFSIPASVMRTEKDVQKEKLIQTVPLDRLLLETDSPTLSPNREERNEPKNVALSCEYIARIKGLDVETVAKATTQNALRLFPKLKLLLHI